MQPFFFLLTVFFPMFLGLSFLLIKDPKVLRFLLPVGAVPALLLSCFYQGMGTVETYPFILLTAHFGIDAVSKIFLQFTSLLWFFASLYSCFYFALGDEKARRFFIFFLIAMSGNFGLIMAQDVVSFYFLFSLMSFASYPLVIHTDSKEAKSAGAVYLIFVVIGELLVFSSILMASHVADSTLFAEIPQNIPGVPLEGWIIGCALLGFGVKAGLIPLHVWLPLAHPVAPTPASAVLSGAMIKAGLIGWLRILPFGTIPFDGWGSLIMSLGLIAAFGAAFYGLFQSKPKAVLAYSSVSQMGVVTFFIGFCLQNPGEWKYALPIILLYAFHHAVAKCSLFLSVGIPYNISQNLFQKIVYWIFLFLPGLAIAGFTLTSGYLLKGSIKYMTKGNLFYHLDIKTILLVSSICTTVLLGRFYFLQCRAVFANTQKKNEPFLFLSWAGLNGVLLSLPYFVLHHFSYLDKTKIKSALIDPFNLALYLITIACIIVFVKLMKGKARSLKEGDVLLLYQILFQKCGQIIVSLVEILERRKIRAIENEKEALEKRRKNDGIMEVLERLEGKLKAGDHVSFILFGFLLIFLFYLTQILT